MAPGNSTVNKNFKFQISNFKLRSYQDIERFLSSFTLYTSLRLDRIKKLLKRLGNPQNDFQSIIVGGTAGKGSTATFLASILSNTGYKTGLYTSPHLEKLNERFAINGRQISDGELVKLAQLVKLAKLDKKNPPSFFELLTAMAFRWFSGQKIDVAILEVGMGGKYDATNIVNNKIAVLTNVNLEHTQFLGDTVSKIAGEKVAILKKNGILITGINQKPVINIIRKFINKQKGQVLIPHYQLLKIDESKCLFSLKTKNHFYPKLKINLLGIHQAANAALAVAAAESFSRNLSVKSVNKGLAKAFIPGRLEVIGNIILDGAHAPVKMKALRESIEKLWPGKNITTIISIKKDKDLEKILIEALPFSDTLIITKFTMSTDWGPRQAASPKLLARLAHQLDPKKKIIIISSPKKALAKAMKQCNNHNNRVICITGSLYLVGELRKLVKLREK